ncbi:hypothetical protein EG346_14770 [Chryseobacterium carnipullorum]|uniref:Uncharacterized protein n=1 Tax=Chryseobacterium carnipullorum TaxID=1124835 RepID=A0A3G6M181_CHRCU|nr:hypothetical protein EG346_14770 [Chryseobacterium carnipullorum]
MVKTRYFYKNFQSLFSANFDDEIKFSFFISFVFQWDNQTNWLKTGMFCNGIFLTNLLFVF